MQFTRHLHEGIRRGIIRCTVRVWQRPRVKVGGRYVLADGHVVVESIEPITLQRLTPALARESGFESVEALLAVARHGSGDQIYLIRFRYLPAGCAVGDFHSDTERPRRGRRDTIRSRPNAQKRVRFPRALALRHDVRRSRYDAAFQEAEPHHATHHLCAQRA